MRDITHSLQETNAWPFQHPSASSVACGASTGASFNEVMAGGAAAFGSRDLRNASREYAMAQRSYGCPGQPSTSRWYEPSTSTRTARAIGPKASGAPARTWAYLCPGSGILSRLRAASAHAWHPTPGLALPAAHRCHYPVRTVEAMVLRPSVILRDLVPVKRSAHRQKRLHLHRRESFRPYTVASLCLRPGLPSRPRLWASSATGQHHASLPGRASIWRNLVPQSGHRGCGIISSQEPG